MSKKVFIVLILSVAILSGCAKNDIVNTNTELNSNSLTEELKTTTTTTSITTTSSSTTQTTPTTTTTTTTTTKQSATNKSANNATAKANATPAYVPASANPAYSGTDKWYLRLVNYQYALPSGFSVNLGYIANGIKVDSRIVEAYNAMAKAAAADGVRLNPTSGYRSVEYQRQLFNRRVNEYVARGYSRENAENTVATYTARPGTSEHNLGLAIDFYDNSTALTSAFENTAQGKWLRANSYKYGFIMRYSSDKTAITKIIYEPWHYRFVGVEDATKIYNSGLCLEEYLERANRTTTKATTTTTTTTTAKTTTTTQREATKDEATK